MKRRLQHGLWVIPTQYDSAASFSDGLAFVEKDGKLMYIDRSGAVVREERQAMQLRSERQGNGGPP